MLTQIGVIGSMTKKPTNKNKKLAREIGKHIAQQHAVLCFGFEDDGPSLPGLAAEAAHDANGIVLAFLRSGSIQSPWGMTIRTGMERGGGREFIFIRSCDAIISIGGGSGTLMEIAMAYQARIPVIALQGSGGWSNKLIGTHLDERKAQRVIKADTAAIAVEQALSLAHTKRSMV